MPGRRAVLRGGLLGMGGLAAAALIGCKTAPEVKPEAAPAAGAPSAANKPKMLNPEAESINDPALPYPLVIPEEVGTPKKGGTFREGWYLDFATWDPTKSSSVTTLRIPNDTGDGLLKFKNSAMVNPLKMEVVPNLATSWETSPDGLTLTFKLTDKAKFHNKAPLNGRALTAEDVRLVYDRNSKGGVSKGFFDNVASMTTVNPTTFQVKLKAPQADFLNYPATRELVIYAMELADNGALDKNQDSIGTGPWILKSAAKSQGVSYVKNPDYWGGPTNLDAYEIRMIPDQAARVAAYRAGQLEYSQAVIRNKREADAWRQASPDFHIIWSASAAAVQGVFADINMKNPRWQDERIRQAMYLGLNREKQLQTVGEGIGYPYMRSLPWGNVFDKRPTSQAEFGPYLKFDPAEARKLLAAAGQDKLEIEWRVSLAYTTDTHISFLVDAYKDAGVTIKPNLVDAVQLASQYNTNQFQDISAGVLIRYTPDNYYKDMLVTGGSLNRSSLSDPQIDEWAKAQSTEVNPQKRRELLRKIWDQLGTKAYRPMEQAAALAPAAVWPKYVRNFWGGCGLNSAVCNSDVAQYFNANTTWLDK